VFLSLVCAGEPGKASPQRGRTLGHIGDAAQGVEVDTFELDPTQPDHTSVETRCTATVETHQALLGAKPNLEMLGPINATSQAKQTRLIK